MNKRNFFRAIPFEKQILGYFLLLVAIVTTIVVLSRRINDHSKITRSRVSHTQDILSKADSLIAQQKDIVIATRGFVISGDSTLLKDHEVKFAAIGRCLNRLKALTKDKPAQLRRLDTLEALFSADKAARRKEIALIQSNQNSPQDKVLFIQAADQTFEKLVVVFNSFVNEENELLIQRRTAYQESVKDAARVIYALLLIFMLSLLSAFILAYRNTVRRNKAEAALRMSEGLISRIIEYAPVLVNVKDLKGKFLLVNKQLADVLNTTPEDMYGKTAKEFLSPEIARCISAEEEEVLRTGQPCELDVKLPAPDGLHTYITSKFPLFDDKGKLYAIGSISGDITPIKRAHEALARQYEQQQQILNGLQEVLSASSDVICIINEKGEFVMLSDTVRRLLGYAPKELMHKKFLDFVVPEDRPKTQKAAAEIMSGKVVYDFTNRYQARDGSPVPVSWTATWFEKDQLMYCIARNDSDRLKLTRQLAQSQARLAHAQTIARMGNWEWNLKHNLWSCSDEIYNLLGARKGELQDVQQALLNAVHPEDREELFRAREAALTRGTKIDVEHRLVRCDGALRYMHTRGEVTLNKEGRPVWFSGTMQDITERKQNELILAQLNQDLRKRAEELKASNTELERFAYVASHDLQEPLRMVSSFLTLLQKRLQGQLDDTARQYIHFATDGAERMKRLIQDLLQYSQLGTANDVSGPVNLSEVLAQVAQTFAISLGENNAVLKVPQLPWVSGDSAQLAQLFQNLVGNALKYRGEAPPVIEISCEEKAEHWVFGVHDNGIGIDPRFFDKIFIIFQRLHNKSEYSGTGIGLAVCKKIVERHGGTIWVESIPNQGSSFFFTLKKQDHA